MFMQQFPKALVIRNDIATCTCAPKAVARLRGPTLARRASRCGTAARTGVPRQDERMRRRQVLRERRTLQPAVVLDAKVGPKSCEARFRANRAPTTNSSSSPSQSLHRVDDGAEGDRSAASLLANQDGAIEEVKSKARLHKVRPQSRGAGLFPCQQCGQVIRQAHQESAGRGHR